MFKNKSAALRHSFFLPLIFLLGCATFYQKNIVFQDYFAQGKMEEANNQLDKNKKLAKGNNKLLYNLQKGVVLQMMGEYEESNDFFEQAYYFTEDYRKNYSLEALSYLTNSTVKPYVGEDHEKVLMHYFKAINYLKLNQLDEALVECRRINIKLNELNDRYANRKNRYDIDPFAHNLMGIVYEASGEVNDAFIAYRNAYEAYQKTSDFFNVSVPDQLKKDLLRTAYLNGFNDELRKFESEFSTKYEHKPSKKGEMVFFWHNGLGPVKSEWSINFFVVKGQGGIVNFENKEYGMTFPFPVPTDSDGKSQLGDLKIVRVTFPKYVDRLPYFHSAKIELGAKQYNLEKAQDISSIAFVTLEDRMVREFANSLIRLAVKQAAEYAARQENENMGALLSIVNAFTEKADTRNWQTLPHDISYSRVPLEEGKNEFKLVTKSHSKDNASYDFVVDGSSGRTVFQVFSSLESSPPSSLY
ncbi:COG3014 family protein [Fulvivirga lutimaris]|uniref:COG3014 family protein n=1 Tax=Fulvivirga lutimaris TaxID=1819566 RepID=UPI0012BC7736|nr:hypothetical protein [Fulvivirga lutimaris]MTI40805.1 hypothetical protein [Fulvivirga lutimaris]